MNSIVLLGLEAITARTNLATGLTHANDKNAAKEMFLRLSQAGEMLLWAEIEAWASANGWQADDARRLAQMGEQIGSGTKPRIAGGPWWREDVIEQFEALAAESKF